MKRFIFILLIVHISIFTIACYDSEETTINWRFENRSNHTIKNVYVTEDNGASWQEIESGPYISDNNTSEYYSAPKNPIICGFKFTRSFASTCTDTSGGFFTSDFTYTIKVNSDCSVATGVE